MKDNFGQRHSLHGSLRPRVYGKARDRLEGCPSLRAGSEWKGRENGKYYKASDQEVSGSELH